MNETYSKLRSWPLALGGPILATLAGFGIESIVHRGNISLAYLLAVLVVASRTSTGPAMLCAVVSFLLYNFFFTEPRFTLLMTHREDIMTVGLFLIGAAIAGQQAVRLRRQVVELQDLNRFQRIQFKLSQDLLTAGGINEIYRAMDAAISELLTANVFIAEFQDGSLEFPVGSPPPEDVRESIRSILTNGEQPGDPVDGTRLFPLNDGRGITAVLGVPVTNGVEKIETIETLVQQGCMALGRTRLAQDVQKERLDKEREMLRSALLSSVSHDIRTPLASMIGSATSLMDLGESLSESQKVELLEAIVQEASRLDNYTRNLLDMTRLEHGELVLDRDWVGLDEILSVALRRIRPVLANRQVETVIPENLPLFYVHGTLIEQAIFNVLDNAVKFSSDASTISVVIALEDERVTIDIKNQGVGVPESEMEHIFNMFHSVDRGDHHSAGTGLGLSIAKGMIGAHGGSIELRETGSQGTTFRLCLPLSELPTP